MKGLWLSVFLIGISVDVWAQPALSLIIEYKTSLNEKQKTLMDDFHKSHQLILNRRLEAHPYDILVASVKDQTISQLCSTYEKQELVRKCTVEYKSQKFVEVECAPESSDVAKLSKKISETFDLSLACLFESDDPNYKVKEGPNLSPLWAQEYVGADLARELVLSDPGTMTVPVSVIDGGFEASTLNLDPKALEQKLAPDENPYGDPDVHGSNVASLVTSQTKTGVAGKASIVWIGDFSDPGAFQKYEDDLVRNNVKPKIISGSTGWNSEDTCNVWERLQKNGTISVASAGNTGWNVDHFYPKKNRHSVLDLPEDRINCESAILVGSLHPTGWQSDFSQEGPQVVISAPSDYFVTASGKKKGKYNQFSGTSGAQPIVAGALANVASFLPDLTFSQAKILLEKTALPTPNSFEKPRMNGAGMVNAYKLAWVAKKIRAACLKEDFKKCQDKLINDPSTYATPSPSKTLTEQVEKVFPDCQSATTKDEESTEVACVDKKKLVQEFRAGLLLSAKPDKEWALLACINRKAGHTGNAEFYELLSEAQSQASLAKILKRRLSEAEEKDEEIHFISRQMTFLGDVAVQLMRDEWVLNTNFTASIFVRLEQAQLRSLSPESRVMLIEKFMQTTPEESNVLKVNKESEDLADTHLMSEEQFLEYMFQFSDDLKKSVEKLDEANLLKLVARLAKTDIAEEALCEYTLPLGKKALPIFKSALKDKHISSQHKKIKACRDKLLP